jgi:hypothetical protein
MRRRKQSGSALQKAIKKARNRLKKPKDVPNCSRMWYFVSQVTTDKHTQWSAGNLCRAQLGRVSVIFFIKAGFDRELRLLGSGYSATFFDDWIPRLRRTTPPLEDGKFAWKAIYTMTR